MKFYEYENQFLENAKDSEFIGKDIKKGRKEKKKPSKLNPAEKKKRKQEKKNRKQK